MLSMLGSPRASRAGMHRGRLPTALTRPLPGSARSPLLLATPTLQPDQPWPTQVGPLSLSPLISLTSGVGIPTVLVPSPTAFCTACYIGVMLYGGKCCFCCFSHVRLSLWHFLESSGCFHMLEGITVCTAGFPSFTAFMACTLT